MWPVEEIQALLPEALHAYESTDFLMLSCESCGWTAWFSASGASPGEIERTAREHRCQDPEGKP